MDASAVRSGRLRKSRIAPGRLDPLRSVSGSERKVSKMGYVKQVAEDNASGAIRRVYDAAVAREGEIAEIIKVQSVDAKSVQAGVNLYTNIMKVKNALTPAQREMIGMVVGNVNDSYYTTFYHMRDYIKEAENKKLAQQIALDYRKAAIEPNEKALCDYAVKLSLDPQNMSEDDLDTLRENGFNDEAIVVTTQVVSYFNYQTRIGNALGVEAEVWMMEEPEEWMKKKGKDYLKKKK